MGKSLLIYVLFFVVVSTTLATEVKLENASKLLPNLIIMFSGLTIISIMFILIDFIYACMHKVSEVLVYKLQDLCTLFRSISCAIFSVLDITLGILLTNICTNFLVISTVHRCV